MPALVAIAAALVVVALAGGDLTLPGIRSKPGYWVLLVLFVLQGLARGRFLAAVGAGQLSLLIWGIIATALIVICWREASLPGVGLIAAGTAANVLVALVNAGMPAAVTVESSPFYHAVGSADTLVALADIVPAPGGFFVSLGDLLMLVGAFCVVTWAGLRDGVPAGAK